MPREVVLGKIREAERMRKELEEDARRQKENILQQARLAAQKMIEDAEAAAERAASGMIEQAVQKIAEEKKAITSASGKEVARQREARRARLPQAADYIVGEFMRQLNV